MRTSTVPRLPEWPREGGGSWLQAASRSPAQPPPSCCPLSPQHQASVGLCVCQMATRYVSGDNRY